MLAGTVHRRLRIRAVPQFSLRTIFLLVLLVSAALAAVTRASETVLSALGWVSLFLPAISTLLAAYTRGSRRALWIGVAVFAFWSDHYLMRGNWFSGPIQRTVRQVMGPPVARLYRSRIEREAYDEMHRSKRYAALTLQELKDQQPVQWNQYVNMKRNNTQDRTGYLAYRCVHLFIALFGGVLVAWLNGLRTPVESTRS